jgi:hypothetical protein
MLWCMWESSWVPIIWLQLLIGSYRTYWRSDVKALPSSELLGLLAALHTVMILNTSVVNT